MSLGKVVKATVAGIAAKKVLEKSEGMTSKVRKRDILANALSSSSTKKVLSQVSKTYEATKTPAVAKVRTTTTVNKKGSAVLRTLVNTVRAGNKLKKSKAALDHSAQTAQLTPQAADAKDTIADLDQKNQQAIASMRDVQSADTASNSDADQKDSDDDDDAKLIAKKTQ